MAEKTNDKPLRVVSLEVENVKRVVAVHIQPGGRIVELTGKNRQGKTSVLDALFWAFSGDKQIQFSPIHKGAERGVIKVDLGEIIVTRTFRAKDDADKPYTTSITVESPEGARFPSPQKLLDGFLSALTFDPIEFRDADLKGKLTALRSLVPGIDFAAVEQANERDAAERTVKNRTAKEKRAQAAGVEVPPDAPTERIDDGELLAEMERASTHNTSVERQRGEIEARRRANDNRLSQAAELEATAQRLREEAGAAELRAMGLRSEHAKEETAIAGAVVDEPMDASALREALEAARVHNANVAKVEQRNEFIADAEIAEAASEDLTKAIDERNADLRAKIAAAKMPVDGIEFVGGKVMLRGVPFEQASDAEQLQASVEIAAAMHPRLRVIRIRDGNHLDSDSWKALEAVAERMDMQVWIESVESGRPSAIVIEDGHVRANLQAAE